MFQVLSTDGTRWAFLLPRNLVAIVHLSIYLKPIVIIASLHYHIMVMSSVKLLKCACTAVVAVPCNQCKPAAFAMLIMSEMLLTVLRSYAVVRLLQPPGICQIPLRRLLILLLLFLAGGHKHRLPARHAGPRRFRCWETSVWLAARNGTRAQDRFMRRWERFGVYGS